MTLPDRALGDPPPCADSSIPRGAADLHVDLPYQVHVRGRSVDLSVGGSEVTAQTMTDGCVRLLVLSIYVSSRMNLRQHTLAEVRAVLDAADRIVAANPGLFHGPNAPVRVVYGVEGSQGLAGALDQIPALVRRGVRLFGLVHARHNDLADSATDPAPRGAGLTPLGERFVRAVYAAGAMVDVSHASDEAFDDVIAIARELHRPVVATHSDARALRDHPRNLADAQLRAIAASGGIVGLNFHSAFLRGDGRRATVDDVVRHATHMIMVMGPSHVALGSDFDGEIRSPEGLESHAGIPALAAALARAGVSAADVRALVGENAMRVLERGAASPVP